MGSTEPLQERRVPNGPKRLCVGLILTKSWFQSYLTLLVVPLFFVRQGNEGKSGTR